MKTDTIAAVATAMSDSGIGIIRVSGEEAVKIVSKIYENVNHEKALEKYDSHTIHYGFIVDEDGTFLDEVMVSVMKSPRSYTTEDTVEINCHGGIFMMKKILMAVVKAGARIAEPGEFTKRAFLNGRIDLSRAEAVMDIIHAKNEFALQSSVNQLKGSVSEKIKKLREEILYEIAFIESALDDPEHISLEHYHERLSDKSDQIIIELDKLLESADDGRMLKEGINTVILGKPNAGKSSLLNLLAGKERAIVTDVAGTTRDTLEETITLGDISLNVIDTAGIRNTEDVVEKIGVEKARKIAEQSDLILYVIDSSVPLDESDRDIVRMIKEKNAVILLNKSDLEEVVSEQSVSNIIEEVMGRDIKIVSDISVCQKSESDVPCIYMIKTSTKREDGIEVLTSLIRDMFFHGQISYNDEVYITNIRHKEAVYDARKSMDEVRKSLEMDMPEDFYSIDLMNAYSSLGMIIGEEIGDDLINEIFSKFCMGK
ncbi:MAG: tRNA uridine-5-carboxymethylaminomethyl(34) synthesis GTPase MnmE [Lachnospiraceae bacterium]|nr:tRNA uridine-5-carboxymethylaminomethyl(34) synthesis GTPase MnmE [Lachnospiraceae bacterium]